MYVSELDPDLPKSLSPHKIKNFISREPDLSLLKLWQALNIDPNEFGGMRGNNADSFPRRCDNCQAEVWEYDLDGEAGNEAVLRISESLGQYCRYLIFKQTGRDWKLLGHIDAWGKYRSPQHAFIVSRGRTWLAIRNQGVSGSGVASYIDFVYLITPKRVVEGFSYMADGHASGGPESFGREFSARVVDCTVRDGIVTVELAYALTSWSGDARPSNQQHRVVLTNRIGGWNSRFNPARSNITEAEFESIYHIE